MIKSQLEKQLGRTLTNKEYSQYMYNEFMKNKKTVKQVKKVVKVQTFNDVKDEYIEQLTEDKSYYQKEYEFVLKFEDNYLLFRKPSIKTHFCFGHGQNGISTEEEQQGAFASKHYADTNSQYFLDENLNGLNENIETIKYLLLDSWQEQEKYADEMYNKTGKWFYHELKRVEKMMLCKNYNNTCYCYSITGYRDEENLRHRTVLKELTNEDLQEILAVYEKQKETFTKRLNTYLKRYGLSKLHTWTYLVD